MPVEFITLRGKRLAVPEDEFFEWHGATACYFRVDWAQPDHCEDPTEWRILHDEFCKDAHGKALIQIAASRAVVVWEKKARAVHVNATTELDYPERLKESLIYEGYADDWRALT